MMTNTNKITSSGGWKGDALTLSALKGCVCSRLVECNDRGLNYEPPPPKRINSNLETDFKCAVIHHGSALSFRDLTQAVMLQWLQKQMIYELYELYRGIHRHLNQSHKFHLFLCDVVTWRKHVQNKHLIALIFLFSLFSELMFWRNITFLCLLDIEQI